VAIWGHMLSNGYMLHVEEEQVCQRWYVSQVNELAGDTSARVSWQVQVSNEVRGMD